MTTMVKLGIGFQKLLTRQGVELDEKMSIICSSTPQHGGYKNSSLLEDDVKLRNVMPCYS